MKIAFEMKSEEVRFSEFLVLFETCHNSYDNNNNNNNNNNNSNNNNKYNYNNIIFNACTAHFY